MMFLIQFIYAFCATTGFAILFHVPKKEILPAGIVGAVGWLVYMYCNLDGNGVLIGCFMGACVVGLIADIFSRIFKEAATVFIIPGILPLVPGAGMYYTTLYFINGELEMAATRGTETLLMAGSISLGLLVIGAIFKIYYALKGNIRKFRVNG